MRSLSIGMSVVIGVALFAVQGQAQVGNTPQAAGRAEVASAVDKAGPYAFNSDRSVADVDPADTKAVQAFVTGLSTTARSDLDTRCGVIIADPATMNGPAGPFCKAMRTAEAAMPAAR